MAKYLDLRADPVITTWLDIIRKKPRTQENYLMGFQKYIEFTGLSPQQLLDESEEDEARNLNMRRRRILTRLLGFRKYLEENYASTSVRNYMNCVYSFYKAYYVTAPKLVGNQEAEPLKENTKKITKDDIRDVLKVTDVLEKAIVLVGVSSGLAEADIINLKVKDFNDGRDDETAITTLKLTRVKTGIEFVTFLTPEATNAIHDYLSFRNRVPKRGMNPIRREQLEKQRVTRDDGYLFVLRNISNAYLDKKKGEEHEDWLKKYQNMLATETDEEWLVREELRKYDDDSFIKLYSRLSEKCGKCNPKGWNTIRSHNMRKYFNSALINGGLDSYIVNHMMGHKARAVDRTYYWQDAEKLKEIFKPCIPHLAIEPALDTVSSPEYLRLLKENETLKSDALTVNQHLEDLVKAAEERIANHYTRIGYDPAYREKYVRDVDWEDKKGQKRHIAFIRKPEEDENV